MGLLENYQCHTGVFLYTAMALALYFEVFSSGSHGLPENLLSLLLGLGLFIVFLASWLLTLVVLGIAAVAAFAIYGFLLLLGVDVGLEVILSLIILLAVAGTAIYHFWVNGENP